MVARTENEENYWVKQAKSLLKPEMLKTAALPVGGAIAANFIKDKNAQRVVLGATAGKQLIDSFGDAFAAYKDGEYADFMMDMLNGTLTGYGIASGDSDAIITSATMRLFKDISHEQEDSIDERYQGAMKERSKRIAGLPMLVHIHRKGEGHDHSGDDHEHPAIYKDNEEIESGSALRLNAHEQEKLMEMIEHWKPLRENLGEGKSAARAIEKFYEKYEEIKEKSKGNVLTRFEKEEFIHTYGFMITELDGKEYDGFNFHYNKEKGEPAPFSEEWHLTKEKVENPDDIVSLPEITLFAPTHKEFKARFDCLYYEVKRGDRDFEPMWARDIVAGDQVKVPAGRGIPVDGVINEITDSKNKQKQETKVDTSQYSGDKGLSSINQGDKIFQMAWNDGSDTLTITAEKSYKTSSGIMFLYGDTGKKDLRAQKQIGLKKAIEKYMYLMMAGGAAYFFKDAIKNGENGKYFDTKTLLSKDNIRKTFEFFVSAAPCPLAASMLVYKGLENSLRDNTGKNKEDLSVRVLNRDQLVNAKDIDTVVFDMIGTLTEEHQSLKKVITGEGKVPELMALAAKLEAGEPHPVAAAIRSYAAEKNYNSSKEIQKKGGYILDENKKAHGGIYGVVDKHEIHVGNIDYFQQLADHDKAEHITPALVEKFREKEQASIEAGEEMPRDVTIVWKQTSKGEGEWAVIGFEETPRHLAKSTIEAFQNAGKEVVIATGSRKEKAQALLKAMQVDKITLYAGLKPDADTDADRESEKLDAEPKTKTEVIRRLIEDKKKVMMVGDGNNDTKAMKMVGETGIAIGMRSANSGLIQDSVGVMVKEIDESYRIHKLSEKLDKTVNQNVNISAGWMGFLVAIHLLGDKIKQWFGFEIGTLVKGALHEGATALIALKGGVWDAKKLTDFYNKIDLLGEAPSKPSPQVARA
jgi:cation transport ATPase